MSDAWDPRLTEARNPRTRGIDRADPREIVRLVQAEDRRVPVAVEAEAAAIAELIEQVAGRMRQGGRLVYVGAGTSGRLGVLDAAECPPTFGTDPELIRGIIAGGPEALVCSVEGAEDDRTAGREAIVETGIEARDFVLGIATSGTTPYVQAAIEAAAERGAGIGFLSCTEPPARMRELADVVVRPLVGPEVVTGSTRLKAGTATKLVLNALTTGAMIQLGKVYENLMVDLRATSLKLADRSLRIVREVTGLERQAARALLVEAGGAVKTALAMHGLQVDRWSAERALDACDGFLGEALGRFPLGEEPPHFAIYAAECTAGDRERLLVRLAEAPRRSRRAAGRLAARAAAEPPREGAWGAREHLDHLAAFESEAVRPRVERILGEADPAFDPWLGADPPGVGTGSLARSIDRFEEARRATLARLEGSAPEALARRARLGEEVFNLFQFLRGVAHHDEAHLSRLEQRVHPSLAGGEAG